MKKRETVLKKRASIRIVGAKRKRILQSSLRLKKVGTFAEEKLSLVSLITFFIQCRLVSELV